MGQRVSGDHRGTPTTARDRIYRWTCWTRIWPWDLPRAPFTWQLEARKPRTRRLLRSLEAARQQSEFVGMLVAVAVLGPLSWISALATGSGSSRLWAIPMTLVTAVPALYVAVAIVTVPIRPVYGTERANRAAAQGHPLAKRFSPGR
jgi:hypothetical protein